ncbi:MAG: hypothetical protein RLZZ385_1470 [Pseudomonadota bacterium]|jgi:ornithine carbamoyltransferase
MTAKHFLTLLDLPRDDVKAIVRRAIDLKRNPLANNQLLRNQTLALIFDKSSTRTRVAFEVAMNQLGGHSLFLSNKDSQLGRGETVEDSARVISRMVDCVAIRTFDHRIVEAFAAHSHVPVINALTDAFHPCQLLADMQTFMERRGDIAGRTVAWIGDGNNMCQSYINAASVFDFQLQIACPEGFTPDQELVERNRDRVFLLGTPALAVAGADLVVTDVWASMGQEQEQAQRRLSFADYRVDHDLMAQANPEALFMHCLPAHRGEEVSAELIDDPAAVVWDEAENRLHSQKALLEYLLSD